MLSVIDGRFQYCWESFMLNVVNDPFLPSAVTPNVVQAIVAAPQLSPLPPVRKQTSTQLPPVSLSLFYSNKKRESRFPRPSMPTKSQDVWDLFVLSAFLEGHTLLDFSDFAAEIFCLVVHFSLLSVGRNFSEIFKNGLDYEARRRGICKYGRLPELEEADRFNCQGRENALHLTFISTLKTIDKIYLRSS